MLSVFWKNARSPKKGKMEQKWAGQLEKINFFVYCSKLAHYIFLIFCMKLETIKGYKLTPKPFFKENSCFADFGHFLFFGVKITFL